MIQGSNASIRAMINQMMSLRSDFFSSEDEVDEWFMVEW